MAGPEQEIYVGIDVSKRTLDVCVLPRGAAAAASGEPFVLTNDQEGVEGILSRLAKTGRSPKLVVLEATGRYERLAATSIAAAGIAVAIVNPRQARDFA